MRRIAALAIALLLAACGSAPPRTQSPAEPGAMPHEHAPRKGGYYKDDGPGASAPRDLELTPDAVPREEPPHRFANRPYEVFGRRYVPVARPAGFRERGTATWYGRRYHGQRTSSGEPYDMYAMTAAHPTLQIPSYVRVTNLANGRSVVVRVNDRGPFLAGRVIDLSYTAALKLGYIQAGSAQVEVEVVGPAPAPLTAASAPMSEPARTPAPAASTADSVYVQLGAFSVRESAEGFRARVYQQLAWLNDTIHVREGEGGLFRLHLGPYASADDARRVAERIEAELRLAPVLVRP